MRYQEIHRDAVSNLNVEVFPDGSGIRLCGSIRGDSNAEYLTLDVAEAKALRNWLEDNLSA